MHKLTVILLLLFIIALTGCNPFYSVEQSNVERGYRWLHRNEYERAIATFNQTIQEYPQSVLAHTGLADALLEAKKDIEAVNSYNTAIDLLKKNMPACENIPSGKAETIGKRFFSYQNQGLEFPHGLEAYLYLRRGTALRELALRDTNHSQELLSEAMDDYDHVLSIAPNYEEAVIQRNKLIQQSIKKDNAPVPDNQLMPDGN